ncbi:MAG TPA: hypothetical protein VMU51_34195 [Mycobacteriales bacterium]|nr:hypothetical protein [Mycobacteriales bacterium]
MRPYQLGDSALRYWLTEPRDAAFHYRGRLLCRLLGRHGAVCAGRRDHRRPRPGG